MVGQPCLTAFRLPPNRVAQDEALVRISLLLDLFRVEISSTNAASGRGIGTCRFHAKVKVVIAVQLDAGKSSTFDPFVKSIAAALAEMGAEWFDYLVNNAGTSHLAPFDKVTEEDLDSLYNVHFKGVFFLTQKLLPLINDGGRIVMISSGLARFAFSGSSACASMKGAVEVLTRYLAKELGPRGIAVNTVAPGAIATDFSGGMVRDNPALNKQIADLTALGRVGVHGDIGPMIASLLSEENRWVNAQRIEISGGMLI
jgi:NAD(P)-dependent dehydrogenase (short-subunit alcohol dehydrogenase family)